MTQPAPTKPDLLGALRSSGDEFARSLRALPPGTFAEGRYENGWNAREILAHVASIEWTYPRLLDLPPAGGGQAAAGQQPSQGGSGSINDYNERQVQKRAGASVAELLSEFEQNRAATIRAVESADDAVLARPVRSAGGAEGPLAAVFMAVAVHHVRGHLRDIIGEGAGS